jgi:hypothetical protein
MEMKRRLIMAVGCLLFAAGLLTGCAQTEYTRLDRDWGTSKKLATFNQVLNPQAIKNLDLIEGIPGSVSQIIVRKYRASFQKSTTAPTYTFNFGRND